MIGCCGQCFVLCDALQFVYDHESPKISPNLVVDFFRQFLFLKLLTFGRNALIHNINSEVNENVEIENLDIG